MEISMQMYDFLLSAVKKDIHAIVSAKIKLLPDSGILK